MRHRRQQYRDATGSLATVDVLDDVGDDVGTVVVGVGLVTQRAVVVYGHGAMQCRGVGDAECIAVGVDDGQQVGANAQQGILGTAHRQAQQGNRCRVGDHDRGARAEAFAGKVSGGDHHVVSARAAHAVDRCVAIDDTGDGPQQWIDGQPGGQTGGGKTQHVEQVGVAELQADVDQHHAFVDRVEGAQGRGACRCGIAHSDGNGDGFSDAAAGDGVGKGVGTRITQRRGVGNGVAGQHGDPVGGGADGGDARSAFEVVVGQRRKRHSGQNRGRHAVGHAIGYRRQRQGNVGGLHAGDAIAGLHRNIGCAVVIGHGNELQPVEGGVDGRCGTTDDHAGVSDAVTAGEGEPGSLRQRQGAFGCGQGHSENIVVGISHADGVAVDAGKHAGGVFVECLRGGDGNGRRVVEQGGDRDGGGLGAAAGGDRVGKGVGTGKAHGGRVHGVALRVDGHGAVGGGAVAGDQPAGVFEVVVAQHVEAGRGTLLGGHCVGNDIGHGGQHQADVRDGRAVGGVHRGDGQVDRRARGTVGIGKGRIDQAIERRVDGGDRATESQGRAAADAALAETEPGGAHQGQRAGWHAEGDRSGGLAHVTVGDDDGVAAREGQACVFGTVDQHGRGDGGRVIEKHRDRLGFRE